MIITRKATQLALTATLLGLTASLSACTLNVNSGTDLTYRQSNLIRSFVPDKGEGASYAVGEAVNIKVSTSSAGYLTILALNSGGSVYPLIQNAYIAAGDHVFPRLEDRVVFNTTEPKGVQRLRAIFTKVRPTTNLVISGNYDNNRWNAVTGEYLAPYAVGDRDVLETFIVVR